jgi:uncharacterized protein YfkK (UPF0435 family)
MKKTIAVIVVLCMVLSGTAAFAEAKGQSGSGEGTPLKNQTMTMTMLSEQLGPQVDEIKVNKANMLTLREQIRIVSEDAQRAIGDMIQKRDQLSLDQVEALKDSLECIRESRKTLEGTIGEIGEEMLRFRFKARNMNQVGASESLENCAKVQTLRIQEMKRVLEVLEEIVKAE